MDTKLLFSIFFVAILLLGCKNLLKKNDFPVIIQEKAIQCGPVCLKMVCQYYGKNIDLKKIEDLTNMSDSGTSLLALSDAAEYLGLKNVAFRLSYEALLEECPMPAIIYWENHRFVVVYKINKNKVWVADPELGKVEYSKKEFCDHWFQPDSPTEGIALVLEKAESF